MRICPDGQKGNQLAGVGFSGRNVQALSFDESSLKVGGFRVLDYFSDGSFYLLDAPGVSPSSLIGRHTGTPFSTQSAISMLSFGQQRLQTHLYFSQATRSTIHLSCVHPLISGFLHSLICRILALSHVLAKFWRIFDRRDHWTSNSWIPTTHFLITINKQWGNIQGSIVRCRR